MKYYISDTHFYHKNAIKFGNRPFLDVEEMNNTLIENWNKTVKTKDEIYILGDLIFYTNRDNTDNLINTLNGRKHLIIGNHDDKIKKEKFAHHFESVNQILEIEDKGKFIVLCHYPMAIWNKQHHHALHFYGHIHTFDLDHKAILSIPEAYNVSADVLELTPRTMEEVIDINNKIQIPLREKFNIPLLDVFYHKKK